MDSDSGDLTRDERAARGARAALSFIRPGYRCGELGVLHGDFSRYILEREPEELHLIDSWCLEPERHPAANGLSGDEMLGKVRERFREDDRVQIVRGRSPEIAEEFEDEFFDWFYIDADHSWESIWRDLRTWSPKVKPGGIFCGHDYLYPGSQKTYPVHHAVDAFWQGNSEFEPLAFSNDWVLRKRQA